MVLSQMIIVCWRAARSWADSWAREQVHLGFQVELALAVDDDFLDERAVPGWLLHGGDVDAAFAVVGGQRMGQGGLAGGVGALDASTMQSRTIGVSQQRGEHGTGRQPNAPPRPAASIWLTFSPGSQRPSPAARTATRAVDRACRRLSTVIFSRAPTSPVLQPAAVQGCHRDAAQLRLGDVQP